MDVILKYTLLKIQEQASEIPNINRGGCCHFSKLLAFQLENRNIDYTVSFFNFFSTRTTVKKIKNKDKYIPGVSHVCLKIGKYYVDSEMTTLKKVNIMPSDYNFTSHKLRHSDLKTFSTNGVWNDSFNKRRYHSIINKIIINQFKIYDKLQNNG